MNRTEEILEKIMEPASATPQRVVYRHISPEKLATYLTSLEARVEALEGKV